MFNLKVLLKNIFGLCNSQGCFSKSEYVVDIQVDSTTSIKRNLCEHHLRDLIGLNPKINSVKDVGNLE